MADGSTKDIEDVELGDEVQATDPVTGETGPREVTRLIVTEDDKYFNELSIATKDGIEKLTATHEHPFWSPSQRDWIEASELEPGMTLLTDGGDVVIVSGNRAYTRHATTYNLTVDDLHTYYVLVGETPVLVHNADCRLAGSGPAPGVLEVSDRVKSVAAVRNFYPKDGRDFVFDPSTGRFATGADQGVGGHTFLRTSIGADESTVVGGRLTRGPNGEFLTNEHSGHYGMNWTDATRRQFTAFMEGHGFTVHHSATW